jgi:hypothetical protein
MTEPVDQLPPELADKCFGSLTSTSKARILPQGDHACYELQRSLEKVSPGFHRKVGGITGREVLVLLHYAADDELSPTRFIPVVSIRMIEILNLSQQEKERLLAADISICDQSRDGKSASQNATITIAVVYPRRFDILDCRLGLETVRSAEHNTVGVDDNDPGLECRPA